MVWGLRIVVEKIDEGMNIGEISLAENEIFFCIQSMGSKKGFHVAYYEFQGTFICKFCNALVKNFFCYEKRITDMDSPCLTLGTI